MKVLKNEKEFYHSWHKRFTAKKGTPVVPASNLSESDLYWLEPTDDMDDELLSWLENYGVLVTEDEIEDATNE
jgi:hypothetical protein